METKILQPTKDNIKLASKALKAGNLVGVPTETVYGLGANAFDSKAVASIFAAKNRPQDNPLIVHIHKNYDLSKLTSYINKTAHKLLKAFTPGPLTLVLKSNNSVSPLVSRGLDTIAIRIPSHKVAQQLLKECDLPIAAPSANISSRMSATTALSVKQELDTRLPYIIDGGASQVGIESTVVDATKDTPIILRPGIITSEQIKKVCGKVEEITKVKDNEKVASPGMKYKHYSPNCPVYIADKVAQQYRHLQSLNLQPVVLGLEKHIKNLSLDKISLGKTNKDYAKNLYQSLRIAEQNFTAIILYGLKDEKFGHSIMNRVNKIVEKL